MMPARWISSALLLPLFLPVAGFAEDEPEFQVGVAQVDITPDQPIRLTGYAVRKTESEGVEQRLWAKALAIGGDVDGPALLITVDNCGICANVIDEVAARLKARSGIPRERIAVCSSHTHSGPCTVGFAPNIFAMPIPPAHQATIERYTRLLTDKLEQVALSALTNRQPARLAWNEGTVGFARNRRVVVGASAQFGDNAGGPVDRSLPVLCATGLDGRVRAVLANYACHCTTLGGEFNKLCGDWAGFAQQAIQRDFPGAIALTSMGCGADANPFPRGGTDGGLALARQHGEELAAEVKRIIAGRMIPIRAKLNCRAKRFDLPFDRLPTRAQWEERAKEDGIVGYHARKNLDRLDRGESLPVTLPYFVQSWNFGGELAMVFLAGEVVVDYNLRLKKEFKADRLWITAYANDVPCYIPSRRILREGGYEAETSLWYYDRPARLAPAIEDMIVGAVHEVTPKQFLADPKAAEFPPPKSPEESLAGMRTTPGFAIEIAAAEPLVVDPVAIDWGADGKLWVAEMRDYPMGLDGHWKPGGRIKLLEDTNGDGKYDQATVFLDGIPFPTGVTAYGKGALICTAPDILYAEDTNGDGKADTVKKLFSGFATDNYQARVNSLSLGLDNWIYGANGLIGGTVHGNAGGKEVNISGRDFRMHPDTGEFEPASGLTQQGRVRDDWGHWFGCDNSTLLWHYPLPDHYVRRNPFFAPPEPRVFVPADADPNHLFPASPILDRFNDPGSAGRTTSACGLGVYRDDFLGGDYYDNAFVCEPVHNLVHRLVLKPDGVTFRGYRAADEQQSEFLASKDNWFRPVQARTGPDGALWVVDMYRFVIEHPRWIPPERLAKLDVRAGDDKGRIYRLYPRGKQLRPIRDLTRLDSRELAAALNSPNGTERDRVHLEILRRKDRTVVAPLIELLKTGERTAVRLQALCVLDGLRALTPGLLQNALDDAAPPVRAHAIRLSERTLDAPHLGAAVLQRVNDPDPDVRYQLALSLGEWDDPRAGEALGLLAKNNFKDRWMRAAILSSASRDPAVILRSLLTVPEKSPARGEMIDQLIASAVGRENDRALGAIITAISPKQGEPADLWQLSALGSLLDSLDRKGRNLESLASAPKGEPQSPVARINEVLAGARRMAQNESLDETTRVAAIALLGREPADSDADLDLFRKSLSPQTPPQLQNAAVAALARTRGTNVPELLLADWPHRSPSLRAAVLGALLAREAWIDRLFDALEKGTIAASEISPANRQRLLKHKSDAIRKRAATLLAGGGTGNRAEVLARFQSAANLPGTAERGEALFVKTCSTCHALAGQGHAVGPDLTAFRAKSAQDFLVAILDPGAAIEPRFINYQIETRDGRSLSGVVRAETAVSLTLVQAGALEEKILRSEIAEIKASNLSLMPEGLEQGMTPQDMADLIAYVKQSGPGVFGGATPERAAAARAEFIRSGANGLAKVVSAAGQLPYPGWLGKLPMPFCRQTDGHSKLVWQTASLRNGLKPDETRKFRLPAAMGFISQPPGKFQLMINGKPALEFDVTLQSRAWRSDDGHVQMTYTVMENNEEDSDGVLEIEVPGALLDAGKPATFEVIGSAANSQRWFGIYDLAAGN